MNTSDPWQRLTVLARTAPGAVPPNDPEDDARFAALVVNRRPRAALSVAGWGLPWETWSLRGVAAAGVLAAVMLTWNFPLLTASDNLPDDVLPPDPVAELAAAF